MKNIFFVILISVLFLSCGKKEEKEEFVEEHPKVVEPETKTDTVHKITPQTTDEKKFTDESSRTNITISPLEAGDYIGKSVNVKGYVADVHQTEKVAYLNFVEKYPDNPFTAVIFANRFSEFGDINKYLNKTVEVGGRVTTYKNKPQIILENKSQIKIVK
jgi:DNA/RNA endonuclease YhcR with UshA esterase domain